MVAEALNTNKLSQKVSTSQLKLSTRTPAAVGRYTGTQFTIQSKNKHLSITSTKLSIYCNVLNNPSTYISNIY